MMISRFCRCITFLLAGALLLATGLAGAAEKADPNTPIQIEADRMESLDNQNAVIFTGKVKAKQGDLIVNSDKMTVYYLSDEEKKKLAADEPRKIKKLFASGNVEIQSKDWVATGDDMEYFELERKVVLTGNTKVWQGNNMVTGDSVTLYLDEGKSIVERSGKEGERVKATFYPGGEKKDK